MDSPASISRFLVFLQVFQPFFSWLRKCPSIQSAYDYNPYCKYKNQDIHYFKILFASKADKVVNIIPNTAIIHILAFSVSDNNGNIRPITMPANMSFDKSKKYPASFSLLVASLFFISSLIFLLQQNFPCTTCLLYSAKIENYFRFPVKFRKEIRANSSSPSLPEPTCPLLNRILPNLVKNPSPKER